MPDDDLAALAERDGWTVEGRTATYCLTEGGWCARIRPVNITGRPSARFHVAVVDERGSARYAMIASTVGEARRLAEGQVRGRA